MESGESSITASRRPTVHALIAIQVRSQARNGTSMTSAGLGAACVFSPLLCTALRSRGGTRTAPALDPVL